MAILNFTGFEQGNTRSTEGSDDYQPPTSGASVQSTIKKNGTYSMEFAKVLTGTPYVSFPFNFDSDGRVNENTNNKGTVYFTGYFRYSSKPLTGDDVIMNMSSGDPIAELRLKSDGKLVLYDFNNYGTPVLLATSSTALSQDTWYRIGLKIVAGASGSYELKIDGASEFSGSRSWVLTGNLGKAFLGNRNDRNSLSFTFYWDDVVADDSAYIDADYAVGILKPNANGSTMTWSGGTGASDYTQVDEIPIDDADYVQSPTSGAPNVGLMNFQSRSDASISNSTIHAIKAVMITRENSSVSSATLIRIRSGSTNSDSDTFNGTTVTQGRNRLLTTDPNTSSAWTGAAIDAIEAGAVENNNVAVRMINVMVYVLYTISTSVNYPITAAQGSFTLTGQTSLLKIGRKLLAVYGAFTLSGQNALFKLGRGIIANVGNFALTSQNTIFRITLTMPIVVGNFALTMQDVILSYGKRIVADFGSFVLTGQNALLKLGRKLSAVYAQFNLTGQNVTLNYGRIMQALYGSFLLTGQDVLLKIGYKMQATYTTFALTMQDIIARYGKTMIASYGAFVLTGQSVLFRIAVHLRAIVGQFTLTGQIVRFARNGLYVIWRAMTKNTTNWVNRDKNL